MFSLAMYKLCSKRNGSYLKIGFSDFHIHFIDFAGKKCYNIAGKEEVCTVNVIFILILIFVLIGINIASCYKFWKEMGWKKLLFPLAFVIFFALIVIPMRMYKSIPWLFLRRAGLFVSAVFFILLIYPAFLFIVRKIVLLIAKAAKKSDNKVISFIADCKKSTPMILLITALAGVAGYVNIGIFRVTDRAVEIDKPAQISSLNAAVIADAHIGIGMYSERLEELTEKINALNPDVILLVGDIIDESTRPEELDDMISAFSKLSAPYGVYFVSGNHEAYTGYEYAPYFEEAGITVLDDSAVTVAGDVSIIGRKSQAFPRKELSQIISENSVDTDKPVIVLNHEPISLAQMAQEGADLTLSGHTHGEQFPFTQELFSFANDMMYGLEYFDGMPAVTTSGISAWGFHFSLPAKSEIVNLTIKFNG